MSLPSPGAHLGDGDVIAAAACAQLSGAGVNRATGGSEAARAGGPCGLHALQSGLKLSNLKKEHLQIQRAGSPAKEQNSQIGGGESRAFIYVKKPASLKS